MSSTVVFYPLNRLRAYPQLPKLIENGLDLAGLAESNGSPVGRYSVGSP